MYRVQWVIRFPHYGRHKGGERSSSHAALPAQPNFTFSTFYFATKPPTASLHSFFILLLLPPCHHFLFHPLSEREGRSQGSRRHAGPGKFLHLCTVPTQDSYTYSANPRFVYMQCQPRKPSLSLSLSLYCAAQCITCRSHICAGHHAVRCRATRGTMM